MDSPVAASKELSESTPPIRGWAEWLRTHLSDTQRFTVIWVVTGFACGMAAVAFHLAISGVTTLVRSQATLWGGEGWGRYAFLGLAPVVGGLLTGIILANWAPHAAGSGIPQTKVRYHRDFGFFQLREAAWRFVLGTISVGSGMSLGREGPTVHICAAIASKIGQVFGLAKKRVQAMVPLGMGAGIAAAFNTPMAAVFFVFEELLGDFSSKSFFGIFLAVVIAAVTNRLLLGEHPAFDIVLLEISTDWWMLLCVPLGLLAALLGRGFVGLILWARERFRRSPLPLWARPAAGGLSVGIIAVGVMLLTNGRMGVFGIGYDDADAVLNGHLGSLTVVLLLLVGKLVATALAFASGASGGLFAPTLFIGAMLGGAMGIVGQMLFGYDAEVVGAVALLGMGAFFAAVIRSPMTSIVMIWEMTGYYALILPLMAGNMLAWVVSARFQAVPLYDALLLQDKVTLRRMPNYQGDRDWRNLPISTIMSFDVVGVQAEESVEAALRRLQTGGLKHHAYPVRDAAKRVVGMVTHQELEAARRERPSAKVAAVQSKRSLVTVRPEDSIREVARILVVEDVLQVPVVTTQDPTRLLGVVTLHDIARQQNAIDESLAR